MSQLVTTTLQIFQQQGRSVEGNDQFFFLTSAQSPAMRTTQQHVQGSVTAISPSEQALNTSHSWHQCSIVHGGLFSAFNPPTNDMPITCSNRAILPIYIFSSNLQMFCNLYHRTQGRPTLLPSRTRGACTKLSGNIYSYADVPKSTKGHSGSFYDSNFGQVKPSKLGLKHGHRLSPASIHTVLHRRGQRPIRHVVQELPITGPRGTAIYPNIRTTAEFRDPKERFWSRRTRYMYARSTDYYNTT